MTRLYLNCAFKEKQIITLGADQSHYLVTVLRKKEGGLIRVFNQAYGEWEAKIEAIQKKQVFLELLHQQVSPLQTLPLWLAFAPLKQDTTNFLLEKATELGVTHLQPLWTERCNAQRLNSERWQKIVTAAAEQCERQDLPQILNPLTLKDFLHNPPLGIRWYVALEREETYPLIPTLIQQKEQVWGFIIGPEGGFSTAEKHLFTSSPTVCSISLGSRILRAETAALATLAIAQATLESLRS